MGAQNAASTLKLRAIPIRIYDYIFEEVIVSGV